MLKLVVLLQACAYLCSSLQPRAVDSFSEDYQILDIHDFPDWSYCQEYDSGSLVLRSIGFLHSSPNLQLTTMALSVGSPEFSFFERALTLVDDAKVNGSPLLGMFRSLATKSSKGYIKEWNQLPFQGPPAPTGRCGYKFFIRHVFKLLQDILVKNDGFKIRVTNVLAAAEEIVKGRKREQDKYGHIRDKKWISHEQILKIWTSQIQCLQAKIDNLQKSRESSKSRGM